MGYLEERLSKLKEIHERHKKAREFLQEAQETEEHEELALDLEHGRENARGGHEELTKELGNHALGERSFDRGEVHGHDDHGH